MLISLFWIFVIAAVIVIIVGPVIWALTIYFKDK